MNKEFSDDVKNFKELFKKSDNKINDKLEFFYKPYDGVKKHYLSQNLLRNSKVMSLEKNQKRRMGIRKTQLPN